MINQTIKRLPLNKDITVISFTNDYENHNTNMDTISKIHINISIIIMLVGYYYYIKLF